MVGMFPPSAGFHPLVSVPTSARIAAIAARMWSGSAGHAAMSVTSSGSAAAPGAAPGVAAVTELLVGVAVA